LGYYILSNGNFLPTFRDNLSVPSSGVKNPKRQPGVPIWSSYREVGRERECDSQCSYDERHSMRKEIITSVGVRNIYMKEVGERKGKESAICD